MAISAVACTRTARQTVLFYVISGCQRFCRACQTYFPLAGSTLTRTLAIENEQFPHNRSWRACPVRWTSGTSYQIFSTSVIQGTVITLMLNGHGTVFESIFTFFTFNYTMSIIFTCPKLVFCFLFSKSAYVINIVA